MHPVGGDRPKSPGAEDTGKGAGAGIGAGGAVGAAIGAVATPVLGPIAPITGAAVGAYAGSLMGSMSQTDEVEEIPDVRQAGMMVAVAIEGSDEEQRALDTLRAEGAFSLERANGQIVNGDWIDFDPLSSPDYIR
jgi:phage tail tape-measure protein